MPALESAIEDEVSRYAMRMGIMTLKLNVSGRRGWPDRIYLCRGQTMFIEFKRLGHKQTPAQQREHTRLTNQHVDVIVVDSIEEGKLLIDEWVHPAWLARC